MRDSFSLDFPDEQCLLLPGFRPALLNNHRTPAPLPCPRENGEIGAARGGRQAGYPIAPPDGPHPLVPRPVSIISRRTIPVLLGSTPLSSARDEPSPGLGA